MIFTKRRISAIGYAAIILCAVFFFNRYQNNVRSFFYDFSSKSQGFLWVAGKNSSDFLTSLFSAGNLKKEKAELLINNQDLLAQIAYLGELKKENDELRNALGFGLGKDYSLLSAEIIAKDISQDYITINKGSADGVFKNMPVVTGHKVLVGKISEVFKNYSKVMLLSNKKSSFGAMISGKEVTGVIKGKGDFKILFDLLPQDKEILTGDTVVSSNFGGIFPAGFLVGKIIEVKKNDIESFQQAEISPSFDINVVDDVFIIINYII